MSVVVKEAQYSSGGKPVAISAVRTTNIVRPEAGTSGYTPNTNGVIRLDLPPSLNFLDTHNSFLSFRVRVQGTDVEKECRMDRSCLSWVRTFAIYSSTGAELERIDHYNLLTNLMHETTSGKLYDKSIAKMIDNRGDRATRNAAMCHPAGCMFNSGFDLSGILNGEGQYLPNGFMQGPITLELTLAPFKDCFVGSPKGSETPTYIIDNVEYHASCLSFSEAYNARFAEQVRTRGVDMSFETYKTHTTTLVNKSVDLSISQNAASVKGVYHVLRSHKKYQSEEYDSLSTYKSGNLKSVQWQLGSQLYPKAPIQLEDDGVTSLYSHNLLSLNMFRNHNLGANWDDTNFHSTELVNKTQAGGFTTSYKALPVRRLYGRWIANGPASYIPSAIVPADTTALPVSNTPTQAEIEAIANFAKAQKAVSLTGITHDNHVFTKTVPTLHFVPNNAKDIHLLEQCQGMRCKMGVKAAVASEAGGTADIKTGSEYTGNKVISSTDSGLDRFILPISATEGTNGKDHNNNTDETSCNILYPGSSCAVAWGGKKADDTETFVAGIGVPFVDGLNRPVLSKDPAFSSDGWVDVIPDDDKFFIGCNMETFQQASGIVSGSNLTNATPLHIQLEYQAMEDEVGNAAAKLNFYEYVNKSDVLTTYVHTDQILRLQNDGTLISSS